MNLLNQESLGYVYLRDSFVFQAVGAAADGAGEVYVFAGRMVMAFVWSLVATFVVMALVVAVVVLTADAVFLFARTVIEGVQEILLGEEGQGTEQGRAVHGGQQAFEVTHCEGIVQGAERLPYHDTHSRRSDVVILQMLGNDVVHTKVNSTNVYMRGAP